MRGTVCGKRYRHLQLAQKTSFLRFYDETFVKQPLTLVFGFENSPLLTLQVKYPSGAGNNMLATIHPMLECSSKTRITTGRYFAVFLLIWES